MPRGPQGQKRPADVIRCAVTVAKIATGEIEEDALGEIPEEKLAPNRRIGGTIGGKARAVALSAERRSEIARKAAQARWG